MMRTGSPTDTSMRFLAGRSVFILSPVVMFTYAPIQPAVHGEDGAVYIVRSPRRQEDRNSGQVLRGSPPGRPNALQNLAAARGVGA